MKVSKNWLKESLDINSLTDDDLSMVINAHVCEIETYTKLVDATNLTIGKVLDCVMHPDSDHLHVCQVEIKDGVVSQIVCGAPNVATGVKAIVALPGAVLPGDFKIKPSKIRGVESNGMLCSLQELGIEEKYVPEQFKNGIYLLDDDAPVGGDPLKYLGLDGYCIDLNVTANRSDLLSIEGVCYDLAAALHQKYNEVMPKEISYSGVNDVKIDVQTKLCNQYNTRLLTNVVIKESPLWMKSKLVCCGIRPINNVVDITNYVLLELGQPLHSFDADKLGKKIVVRNAYDNEKLVTLDNIERDLTTSDIVIADDSKALCLGGVMGGLSTEVTNQTTSVLLEAASFDPLTIRKTSSRLGLKSESSTRFERKIDEERVLKALNRATELMVMLCDAKVCGEINSVVVNPYEEKSVDISLNKINSILGTKLSLQEVNNIFNDLAYNYTVNDNNYHIILPARRMDLEPSVQDICEDVARMYGYDNIPTTLAKTSSLGGLTVRQARIRAIRHFLCDYGLNEAVTYSLINKKNLNDFTTEERKPIAVLMPMTEDRAVMRQSVLNGVVEAISYNKARKMPDTMLFEIGNRYYEGGQDLMLAIGISGLFEGMPWSMSKHMCDFYTLKGIVLDLFNHLGLEPTIERATNLNPNFHPGRCASVNLNGKQIGFITALHPKYTHAHNLNDTYVCEICLEDVLSASISFEYQALNKYPTIERDLAIVCKKDIEAKAICDVIKQTARKYLSSLEIFDVYTGENVNEDEKSLAIKLVFEDHTKTLETADVDKVIKSILNRLDFNFKAHLR